MIQRPTKCLYVVWRSGKGKSRICVGKISRNKTDGITFKYIQKGVERAQAEGFHHYPDFPNLDETYKDVLPIFAQRLNQSTRSDIASYYDFWDIAPEYKDDKYYILCQTQGISPADNFEFLADYYLVKDLSFTSEISGLSYNEVAPNTIHEGDILDWKLENNIHDKKAVVVYHNGKKIGYIKHVHNRVFHNKRAASLKVEVKAVDQNGKVNRIFVRISNK